MTEEEYYSVVAKLGLRPTQVPTVYVTGQGDLYNVPIAARYTAEQRAEIIERLKMRMGITWGGAWDAD